MGPVDATSACRHKLSRRLIVASATEVLRLRYDRPISPVASQKGRGRMRRLRRAIIGLAIVLAGALAGPQAQAQAQDYPSRPVRVVVGFAPGAVADIIARAMASQMSKGLGQQLVVENRPGA